jgi:hypothetical protein
LFAAPFLRKAMSWVLSQSIGLGQRLGGDVGGVPLIDLGPLEPAARDHRAHEVARGVAIAAMAERLDQVSASIPLRAPAGYGREPLRAEEQHAPRQHVEADIEREAQLVGVIGLFDRRQTAEIGPERHEIVVADPGEGIERHRRVEIFAVGANPGMHCVLEVVKRPAANPGLAIRRDVGGIDRAERRVHPQPAGIRLVGRAAVAGHAIGGAGEVTAARDQTWIGCRLVRGGADATQA